MYILKHSTLSKHVAGFQEEKFLQSIRPVSETICSDALPTVSFSRAVGKILLTVTSSILC